MALPLAGLAQPIAKVAEVAEGLRRRRWFDPAAGPARVRPPAPLGAPRTALGVLAPLVAIGGRAQISREARVGPEKLHGVFARGGCL